MKYTQEDLQDALDLAKPGRILELDSDGNMSKNCVAAVIHNLCALAEYYDFAKSQEARWYKEFTDETSKHSAAIKRAEEAEAKLAAEKDAHEKTLRLRTLPLEVKLAALTAELAEAKRIDAVHVQDQYPLLQRALKAEEELSRERAKVFNSAKDLQALEDLRLTNIGDLTEQRDALVLELAELTAEAGRMSEVVRRAKEHMDLNSRVLMPEALMDADQRLYEAVKALAPSPEKAAPEVEP